MRLVMSIANLALEVEGGKVRFVYFALAEGKYDKTNGTLDFNKIFALLLTLEGKKDGVFVVVDFESPFAAISIKGEFCHYAYVKNKN